MVTKKKKKLSPEIQRIRRENVDRGRKIMLEQKAFGYDPSPCFIHYLDVVMEKKGMNLEQLCKTYEMGRLKLRNIQEGKTQASFSYIMWVVNRLNEPIYFV